MKLTKLFKKTIPFLTAFLITSINIIPISATDSEFEAENQLSVTPISQEYIDYINSGKKSSLIPSPIDLSHLSNTSNNSQYILHATTLPSSYDLRTKGLDNYIRSQGQNGTCWAIAATEAMESTMLYQNPLVDLSEWHLAYFSYAGSPAFDLTSSNSIFSQGGNSYIAIASLSNWIGAVDESDVPYASSSALDLSMRYNSKYHLKDANFLSSISQINQAVYNGSAISVGYFADPVYYNSSTYSQYCNNMSYADMATGHAVTIVGWDDNYSKDNFNSSCRPSANGAWLVKNSWNVGWGNDGYFWLSYYDDTVHMPIEYSVEPAENYSENYHYDDFGWLMSISASSRTSSRSSYMANIFTASEDSDICGTGFYTTDNNASYEVTIYTNLTNDANPTSGIKHITQTGSETYAGYHTLELNEPVTIKAGEKYSIVMKLTNPTTSTKPIPVEASISGLISASTITSNTQSGQSFVSSSGLSWTDLNGKYYSNLGGTVTTSSSSGTVLGNVCLKAFARPTLKVTFSDENPTVPFGSEITLSSNGADAIYYTLDGSTPTTESRLYSEPITIDSDVTISAIAVKDGEAGNVETHSYTQSTCGLSSLIIKNQGETAKNLDTTKDMSFNTDKDTIIISPITTADIEINGEKVTSGAYYSVPLIYGNNIVTITLSDDGKLSKTYSITVNSTANKPIVLDYSVDIDYINETISFDNNAVSVIDIKGNKITSDISNYIGSSLTITPTDNTPAYTLNIPARPEITNDMLKLSNSTETSLTFEPIENALYKINSNGVASNWQISSEFNSLNPNTSYTIEMYIPATSSSFASNIISNNFSTLSKVLKGDIYEDNQINVFDLLLLKQHLISNTSLSTTQLRSADINSDNKVTLLDMIELIKYFV